MNKNIDIIYGVVAGLVAEGIGIKEACTSINIHSHVFYRKITNEQKRLLAEMRVSRLSGMSRRQHVRGLLDDYPQEWLNDVSYAGVDSYTGEKLKYKYKELSMKESFWLEYKSQFIRACGLLSERGIMKLLGKNRYAMVGMVVDSNRYLRASILFNELELNQLINIKNKVCD